jgi:hypothetical protein
MLEEILEWVKKKLTLEKLNKFLLTTDHERTTACRR